MTPTMSLGLLTLLIAGFTVVEGWFGVNLDWPALRRHLIGAGVAAVAVWLLNQLLWAGWSDRWGMLGLLLLEGVALGLAAWAILRHFSPALPATQETPAPTTKSPQDSGVVHLRRFRQTRGVLPGGVMVVWNERRGQWSSLEAALEDERNALAS